MLIMIVEMTFYLEMDCNAQIDEISLSKRMRALYKDVEEEQKKTINVLCASAIRS